MLIHIAAGISIDNLRSSYTNSSCVIENQLREPHRPIHRYRFDDEQVGSVRVDSESAASFLHKRLDGGRSVPVRGEQDHGAVGPGSRADMPPATGGGKAARRSQGMDQT